MRSGRRLVQGGRPKDRSRSGGTAAATPGSELGNGREQKASKRKKKKSPEARDTRTGELGAPLPSADEAAACPRPRRGAVRAARPGGLHWAAAAGAGPRAHGRRSSILNGSRLVCLWSCGCGLVERTRWGGQWAWSVPDRSYGPRAALGLWLVLPARSCWAATALEELRPTGRRVRSYYACRRVCGVGRVALQVWYTGVRDKCPRGVIPPFLFKKFV